MRLVSLRAFAFVVLCGAVQIAAAFEMPVVTPLADGLKNPESVAVGVARERAGVDGTLLRLLGGAGRSLGAGGGLRPGLLGAGLGPGTGFGLGAGLLVACRRAGPDGPAGPAACR